MPLVIFNGFETNLGVTLGISLVLILISATILLVLRTLEKNTSVTFSQLKNTGGEMRRRIVLTASVLALAVSVLWGISSAGPPTADAAPRPARMAAPSVPTVILYSQPSNPNGGLLLSSLSATLTAVPLTSGSGMLSARWTTTSRRSGGPVGTILPDPDPEAA